MALTLVAVLSAAISMAQVSPVPTSETPVSENKKGDTLTTLGKVKTDTDIQTMDAVKTQNHPKVVPQSEKKDTIRRKRTAKRRSVRHN